MKKLFFSAILLLSVFAAAGCSKKLNNLSADSVTADTMVAKADGKLQIATVEDFNKDYYNLNELSEFVKKEIDLYNKKAGKDKVIFDDLQKRGGKAIMLLSYTGMDQYTAFNEVTAAYFNGGNVDVSTLNLPETLVNYKNRSAAKTGDVIKNEKYKILVVNEPYDIIVDGKIQYYSDNAKLEGSNKIQSAKDGMTVIVYKH